MRKNRIGRLNGCLLAFCWLALISTPALANAPREQSRVEISSAINNFFQHRFDADKATCMLSISKNYKVDLGNGKTLDYQGLRAALEERSKKISLVALLDLKITELKINDTAAVARVEFIQKVRLPDGKIIEKKHAGEIFLRKEDRWKIIKIVDLLRAQEEHS